MIDGHTNGNQDITAQIIHLCIKLFFKCICRHFIFLYIQFPLIFLGFLEHDTLRRRFPETKQASTKKKHYVRTISAN